MELTQEVLDRYIGGQVEVQNSAEGCLYRGEIASLELEGEGDDAKLKVTHSWMAKGDGFPPFPKRWINDTNLTYAVSLFAYSVSDIGQGRIMLQSSIVGEITVLYPPDGSRLDPAEVEGLELTRS